MAGWIVVTMVIVIVGILVYNVRKNETTSRSTRNIHRTTSQQHRAVLLSQKNETGPMVYYANDNHRFRDKEYRFNYKKVNGFWRAYILRMPSLGNRSEAGHLTHRLWDGNNDAYICWDSPVKTLSDMQNISRVWADCVQEYIATGKRFG